MLQDDARLCLFVVISQERASVSAPCIKALRQFVKQNVDWLEAALESARPQTALQSRLPSRDMAEVLFGAFEGFMVTSLCEYGLQHRSRGLQRPPTGGR
ncbi:MAG: hypothetical protein ACJ8R9_02420 [Steroidobacteraceae bacterium]